MPWVFVWVVNRIHTHVHPSMALGGSEGLTKLSLPPFSHSFV